MCNDDGDDRVEGEIHPNIKPMFCKNRFQGEADKRCSLKTDSGLSILILNNPWAIMMFLYTTHDLLLHLLLYHQSLRRLCAVRQTLLSKFKLLLFILFYNNQLFRSDETDSFAGYFLPAAAGNMTFYHFGSHIHSVIYINTPHKIQEDFIHSLHQFLLC